METTVQQQAQDMAAWIGLDWADQKHIGTLQPAGGGKREAFVVEHTPEALQSWIEQLRARFAGRPVAIAVEQSRGALIYALMHVGFIRLYPVNPQTLAKFRQALYPSGAKDDPDDAGLLLELLLKHRDHLRVWTPDDVLTRSIQLLVEGRRKLVDQRTALTNQLTALLKGYFPQALTWAGKLSSPLACDFLEKWPSLQALQQAKPGTIRKFYIDHGCRGRDKIERRIEDIRRARPLTQDSAVVLASTMMLPALVGQIRPLIQAIDQFDHQIQALFDQHDDRTLFRSLPGAGPTLSSRLLAAFGSDRNRFECAGDLQQLSGIAPVTERSGQSIWVHWRRACPKFLRQTFHEFAAQSIRCSTWARAYYQQRLARGKSHHAAVRALAYKWIRILFRCWKNRTPYDESVYCAALTQRHSPLAAAFTTAIGVNA